mgnify:CR=1 FL=1
MIQIPDIAKTGVPIVWVVGEKDEKFMILCEERVEGKFPTIEVEIAPGVGHRLPWAAPDWFCSCVVDALDRFAACGKRRKATQP